MPQVTIQIKNIAEIKRAFDASPRIMSEEWKKALVKSALQVQRESMIRTPVDTGRLRASHGYDVQGQGFGLRAEVGPTADYAIFVHEGTRFMRGRPFLKDGADASLNEIDDFFTKSTQDAFNRIGRMV